MLGAPGDLVIDIPIDSLLSFASIARRNASITNSSNRLRSLRRWDRKYIEICKSLANLGLNHNSCPETRFLLFLCYFIILVLNCTEKREVIVLLYELLLYLHQN